eukprot:scaffold123195_cov18-Tisochrysis_lutea.AAC.2
MHAHGARQGAYGSKYQGYGQPVRFLIQYICNTHARRLRRGSRSTSMTLGATSETCGPHVCRGTRMLSCSVVPQRATRVRGETRALLLCGATASVAVLGGHIEPGIRHGPSVRL